jgi:hypothetical protein
MKGTAQGYQNYQMLILTLAEVSQESLLDEISLESLLANNML